ncbi:MAG: ECF transporter S component [Clostridia bacterium]|nr:ECF transporter S component [Clostridia bacterium]
MNNTKKLVFTALMLALSIVLSFIEIPLFPPAPWLKFDFCAVVSVLCGMTVGIGYSVFVSIASAVFHGFCMGDPFGAIMQALFCICWSVPTLIIIRKKRDVKRLVVALVVSALTAIIVVLGANLVITPLYTGTTIEQVSLLIFPAILPFNIIKVAIDSAVLLAVQKPYTRIINSAFKRQESDGATVQDDMQDGAEDDMQDAASGAIQHDKQDATHATTQDNKQDN